MVTAARFLILCAIVLTSCTTAKRAAVSTFRVIDAPARYVRERIDEEEGTTTTTTTQTTAVGTTDVVTPGRPVTPPTPQTRTTTSRTTAQTGTPETPRTTTRTATTSSTPGATPSSTRAAAGTTEFPTARPVPGKPGFVYSIDPSGGMVDVTGYKSGDKAKDPYTKQIFIVP